LDRTAPTLSGGEAQRIRLASQLGANLTGITYVLDEPTIGLHPRDNKMLLKSLRLLKGKGNTVIIVEHDEETIKSADYVIDIGPGAGFRGGLIVAQGTPAVIAQTPTSLTGLYLSKKKKIKIVESKTEIESFFTVRGATLNNLKNIDISIPVGKITCVTGVSGSGKSTLVVQTIYELLSVLLNSKNKFLPDFVAGVEGADSFDKIISINQSPIGRTSRSNPTTYTGIFGTIREIFASLPESKMKGFSAGRFSFNVKDGSCSECSGAGSIKLEMSFLPDVNIQCESCEGKRFDQETLSIFYRGKNIADVLDMNFLDAASFFSGFPLLKNKIDVINSVGLEYLKLGQDATTLSGGEAQRIKLSKELIKKNTGKTFYILDEPTIGLHYEDIDKLLSVIYQLRHLGNTVVIIEHNMEIVNASDYILDLGPDGGASGGYLTFQGLKKDFLSAKNSETAKFLRAHIKELER
jgi:excinuclease ABC subunit A